jgi:hypothetical protein
VTLPYFIPFLQPVWDMYEPLTLKQLPKNKRVMLDIVSGSTGRLDHCHSSAAAGISLSPVEKLPRSLPAQQGFILEGNSALYLLAKLAVKASCCRSPCLQRNRCCTGCAISSPAPLPWGGRDVMMPSPWAGWAGLLVTALNLILPGNWTAGT